MHIRAVITKVKSQNIRAISTTVVLWFTERLSSTWSATRIWSYNASVDSVYRDTNKMDFKLKQRWQCDQYVMFNENVWKNN